MSASRAPSSTASPSFRWRSNPLIFRTPPRTARKPPSHLRIGRGIVAEFGERLGCGILRAPVAHRARLFPHPRCRPRSARGPPPPRPGPRPPSASLPIRPSSRDEDLVDGPVRWLRVRRLERAVFSCSCRVLLHIAALAEPRAAETPSARRPSGREVVRRERHRLPPDPQASWKRSGTRFRKYQTAPRAGSGAGSAWRPRPSGRASRRTRRAADRSDPPECHASCHIPCRRTAERLFCLSLIFLIFGKHGWEPGSNEGTPNRVRVCGSTVNLFPSNAAADSRFSAPRRTSDATNASG